ncbi:MAG: hypothetical protein HY665_01365 [Chloroflexi bacterium]|nr:hypothetical protein [Chloroflexota bacterium]
MVEIIYRDNSHEANLAGRSVAEVRDLYKSELGIPDRAQASLNGKQINKKRELETKLGDGDELQFEEKSKKGLLLLSAFLITLLVTGSLYAYTSLVTSTTISVALGSSDFASVSVNGSGPAGYTLLGRRVGSIGAGTLFNIERATGYTGDLEVQVYLSNIDELVQDYSYWMVRVEIQDASGTRVDSEDLTAVLSLSSPIASFAVTNWTDTRYVSITGGAYRALPFGMGLSAYDPLILGQVVQAGQ